MLGEFWIIDYYDTLAKVQSKYVHVSVSANAIDAVKVVLGSPRRSTW